MKNRPGGSCLRLSGIARRLPLSPIWKFFTFNFYQRIRPLKSEQ